MNKKRLFGFIIGIIIGLILENLVIHAGDQVLASIVCENANDYQQNCEFIKWFYFIGTKIIFPIAGGIFVYIGIKKYFR